MAVDNKHSAPIDCKYMCLHMSNYILNNIWIYISSNSNQMADRETIYGYNDLL